MSGSVRVHGGEYSIAADFDDVLRLAVLLEHTAGVIESELLAAIRSSVPDELATAAPRAALDPIGAIELAEELVRATALAGLVSAGCRAVALSLRAAAASYRTSEDLRARWIPMARGLSGMPMAIDQALTGVVRSLATGRPGAAVTEFTGVARHDPQLAAVLLNGILSGGSPAGMIALLSNPSPLSAHSMTSAALGARYPDGRPLLTRRPTDPTADRNGPPRGMHDVIDGLRCRSENTTGGGVDVRFVSDGSAQRHVIVDITGTRDWQLAGGFHSNVADLGTNLRAMGNQATSYELGVLLAMQASGVQPGDRVMLVGHSQGGLVAARLAADLAGSQQFTVTHLVTVGSPIGTVPVPPSVRVLAVENQGDVVPQLDARDNPATATHLTVEVDRGGASLGTRHSLPEAYLPAAADLDASTDPSLVAWRHSATGFFSGQTVDTQVFQVGRAR